MPGAELPVAAAGAQDADASGAGGRPNVVVVMTDDQDMRSLEAGWRVSSWSMTPSRG